MSKLTKTIIAGWYGRNGLALWLSSKESTYSADDKAFNTWVGNIPWRRKWPPTLVFLPKISYGQRSLVDYSPTGCKALDITE